MTFEFATDIARAEYLINNVSFCEVSTRNIDEIHVACVFEVEEQKLNKAMQSIFHCGITYGVQEIKNAVLSK